MFVNLEGSVTLIGILPVIRMTVDAMVYFGASVISSYLKRKAEVQVKMLEVYSGLVSVFYTHCTSPPT
jgi:hypothetical protein